MIKRVLLFTTTFILGMATGLIAHRAHDLRVKREAAPRLAAEGKIVSDAIAAAAQKTAQLAIRDELLESDRLDAKRAHSRKKVPCTVFREPRTSVILGIGQSNMINIGDKTISESAGVYQMFNGDCYRAEEPLMGVVGNGGNVLTRIGRELVRLGFYDRVLLIPAAVGGSRISEWKPGGPYFNRITFALEQVALQNLRITHVLWHQGEADAASTSTTEYMRAFQSMAAGIRKAGIGAPIFVSVASRCYKQGPDKAIQEAQLKLIDHSLGILEGPNTDLLNESFRRDGCHFSDRGIQTFARMWVESLTAMPGTGQPASRDSSSLNEAGR